MPTPNIPGFRIIRPLSEGKRSRVYLAEQESLQRLVSLKILSIEVSSDDASRQHVIEDGKAAARLTHPNLLSVFDIGEHAGSYYIATEHVSGGTLRDKLETGPMGPEQALLIARDLAIALAFLHSQGFLHQDVKPTNILFREDGSALLGEAGVSRTASSRSQEVAFGSPHYMSPERAQALPADSRSDLYSLGVVLWEMLTGKPPFDADDPFAVAIMHISEPVPALPPALSNLQTLLARCLAKQPEQRYPGASEFAHALDQALDARGVSVSTLPQPALRGPVAAPISVTAVVKPIAGPPPRFTEPKPAPRVETPPADGLGATAVMQPFTRPHPEAAPPAPLVKAPTAPVRPPAAAPPAGATMVAPRLSMPAAPAPSAPVDLGATMVAPRTSLPAAPTPSAPVDLGATMVAPRASLPQTPTSAPPSAAGATMVAPRISAPPPSPAPPSAPAKPPEVPVSLAPPVVGPPPPAYGPRPPAVVHPKGNTAAGWLIWIGVIGLLMAATAAWWVLKGRKQMPDMEVPEASSSQLGGSQGDGTSPSMKAEELVTRAQAREKARDFILPEDDNAAYFYLQALKLEPANRIATEGAERVAQAAENQINAELTEGKGATASALIEAALRYYPKRQSFLDMQRNLQQ